MSNERKIVTTAGPPSAPVALNGAAASGFNHRPPPPSYEESQRMYVAAANRVAPNHMPNSYMPTYNYNAQQHQMQTPNYSAHYAAPPPQYYQHHYVTATAPATFNTTQAVKEPHVLSLAAGAKIRTTATGAVSIPPPPPGYAPTAAQYAAMQGQPVVLKKTKRSFF
ncbi:DAZ-associated protein 2 [Rhagoletis pomonella]|uniref:DAZ-associated protein 2 n=1 Tax=Rhagoletis pomonella TaxID=28610 RepID=UPI001784AD6F|nr:DAZ-associated protein 2 [Rhagoletis pomonella]